MTSPVLTLLLFGLISGWAAARLVLLAASTVSWLSAALRRPAPRPDTWPAWACDYDPADPVEVRA